MWMGFWGKDCADAVEPNSMVQVIATIAENPLIATVDRACGRDDIDMMFPGIVPRPVV